jgi:hypothetical protein
MNIILNNILLLDSHWNKLYGSLQNIYYTYPLLFGFININYKT